ncbi:MAG: bifunctional NADP-dependent methylenetetrahydromethanopterin dehydrogenase/methylenetetrahydrofolate dehydrogenase [Planctomyces sp.]|nr:bifunctional NADP-dependent methylenetetrahydromethanopterin dehydrogenase/methylenetetrahydrofolate dehydrogenase [Planctomyces sp.]
MKRILIQLDTDPLPSAFDRVVAIDADVDQLFSYGGVTPANATALVHGAIFTRAPADLKNTAIFIGGSRADAGEAVLEAVRKAFFGPMRVSAMLDSNGSNTTAAAAVRAASKHVTLDGALAVVLGGTGPVGHRAAQILASQGATVVVVSRDKDRADAVCRNIAGIHPDAQLQPASLSDGAGRLLESAQILIAAGAAGARFFQADEWRTPTLKTAIDLNAVPPAGLDGIGATDKAAVHGGVTCYGAIGVGGLKMKIHKAALARLFESNDRIIDTAEVYGLATGLA